MSSHWKALGENQIKENTNKLVGVTNRMTPIKDARWPVEKSNRMD